jgi:iron-sulfur cluster repair protein YtfE (RIC family)
VAIRRTDAVSAIARRWPQCLGRLDELGLEYWIGNVDLATACLDTGLDCEQVLAALDEPVDDPPPSWADLRFSALADHLLAEHHATLHRLLDELTDDAESRSPAFPDARRADDPIEQLHSVLRYHLRRAENIAYPMIAALERRPDPVTSPGTPLTKAVQHIAAGYAEALKMLDQPPAGATRSAPILIRVRTELRLHAHKTHNILLPDVAYLEQPTREPSWEWWNQ